MRSCSSSTLLPNCFRFETAFSLSQVSSLIRKACGADVLMRPGQYDPNTKLDDQAFIDGFRPTMDILSSKMMPRKLVIHSYKKDFTFLLKGGSSL